MAALDESTPGGVIYEWAADDLSVDGLMFAEVVLRWGTAIATFPDNGYLQLTVLPSIVSTS